MQASRMDFLFKHLQKDSCHFFFSFFEGRSFQQRRLLASGFHLSLLGLGPGRAPSAHIFGVLFGSFNVSSPKKPSKRTVFFWVVIKQAFPVAFFFSKQRSFGGVSSSSLSSAGLPMPTFHPQVSAVHQRSDPSGSNLSQKLRSPGSWNLLSFSFFFLFFLKFYRFGLMKKGLCLG